MVQNFIIVISLQLTFWLKNISMKWAFFARSLALSIKYLKKKISLFTSQKRMSKLKINFRKICTLKQKHSNGALYCTAVWSMCTVSCKSGATFRYMWQSDGGKTGYVIFNLNSIFRNFKLGFVHLLMHILTKW